MTLIPMTLIPMTPPGGPALAARGLPVARRRQVTWSRDSARWPLFAGGKCSRTPVAATAHLTAQTRTDDGESPMPVYAAGDRVQVPKWGHVPGTVRSVFPDGDLSVACDGSEWIETELSPDDVEPLP